MTSSAYLAQLRALMPPGEAWDTSPGSEMGAILSGISKEFVRVDTRAADLLRERHPRTAVELLPEWEAHYGVPTIPGSTIEQRQIIVAWYHSHGGDIKMPHYAELAELFGYTATIAGYTEAMCEWYCCDDDFWEEPWLPASAGLAGAGDTLAAEDRLLPWIWEVTITAIPAVLPAPTIEELINDLRPAHIHVNYRYPEA